MRLLAAFSLALLGFSAGGCAVVKIPLAVAQGTARAVASGASALVPSKKPSQEAVAKNAAAADSRQVLQTTSSRERNFNERINKPDLTLAYLPAEKAFQANAGAPLGRSVPTKPFLSDRVTPVREFRTTALPDANVRAVPVRGFDTRSDPSAARSAAGTERTVATRSVRTRDLPEAGRTAQVRGADPRGGKLFAVKGKRQDSLDAQYAPRKPMSVDDVRDLLNKGPRSPNPDGVTTPR
ncbi:MAG: hypothetical protein JSR82_23570 [Verrucomicrobia bacterium]|nr:hypothetical protein [Verrucomicrobiota bacterium]